jgi:large subunit ribosomal protein L15
MKLNELADKEGAVKNRRRVGRGIGSGRGKTCGRGVKGQKSRSGVAIKGYEGGQMPIYRRLPKRGFHNPFKKDYSEINLGLIQNALDNKKLDGKAVITSKLLQEAGVVKRLRKDGVRLLGGGDFSAKVSFEVESASGPARDMIEKAGGSLTLVSGRNEVEASENQD